MNISLKKESNYSFRDTWPKINYIFHYVLKSFLPNYLLPCSFMKMILLKISKKGCNYCKQRINCICLELLMCYLRQAHICLMWIRIWPHLNHKKGAHFCVSAVQSDSHKNFSNLFVFYGQRPYLLWLNLVCLGWNIARWTLLKSQKYQ